MGKLLLLFIVVPAVELALLIEIGRYLGTVPTLLIIVFTGLLGAFLARREGMSVLRAAQAQMQRGELPAGSLADGVMIVVAAALLVTPGVLTDAVGFLLLVPAFRNGIKALALRRFRKAVEENRIRVSVSGFGFPTAGARGEPESEAFDAETYRIETENSPKYRIH